MSAKQRRARRESRRLELAVQAPVIGGARVVPPPVAYVPPVLPVVPSLVVAKPVPVPTSGSLPLPSKMPETALPAPKAASGTREGGGGRKARRQRAAAAKAASGGGSTTSPVDRVTKAELRDEKRKVQISRNIARRMGYEAERRGYEQMNQPYPIGEPIGGKQLWSDGTLRTYDTAPQQTGADGPSTPTPGTAPAGGVGGWWAGLGTAGKLGVVGLGLWLVLGRKRKG